MFRAGGVALMRAAADPLAIDRAENPLRGRPRSRQVAARQARGARPYQEDSYGQRELDAGGARYTLLVLADGMGGHIGGATASRVAVAAALATFVEATGTDTDRLRQALAAANGAIADAIQSDARLAGSGSTFVAVAIGATGLAWISVGDSPLWLVRDGRLRRLNADHSMVPVFAALVAEGAMTAAEAQADSKRHILRSALTGDPIKLIDASSEPLPLGPSDQVLLASDGILTLGEDRIAAILGGGGGQDAPAAAAALLAAVEAKGVPNQDNTTILLYPMEN
jgi:protein phosphatase